MESEKDLRNKKILDLHNSGNSMGEISKQVGLGKTSIHKILTAMLKVGDAPSKEVVEVKLEGTEERFESFVGWERTNVNEYANKNTGETIRVVYVKAKSADQFGYFVKLSEVEKKSNPTDDVIKEAEANLANDRGVKL